MKGSIASTVLSMNVSFVPDQQVKMIGMTMSANLCVRTCARACVCVCVCVCACVYAQCVVCEYIVYVINPRHACAARVTVVVSCVCVCVCLYVCMSVRTRYSGSTRN